MGLKHDANYRFFKKIDNPIKAYWLGVLWGDGNNYRGKRDYQVVLEIQKRDREWLKTLKQDLEATYPIEKISNRDTIRLRILSKKMSNDLIEQGLVPNKSKTQNVPSFPPELTSYFVRGLFDADGHIDNRGPQFKITNTKAMCNFVYQKSQNLLNLGGGVYHKRRHTYMWELAGINQVKKFGQWIYEKAKRKLLRKYEVFQGINKGNYTR